MGVWMTHHNEAGTVLTCSNPVRMQAHDRGALPARRRLPMRLWP